MYQGMSNAFMRGRNTGIGKKYMGNLCEGT